MQPLIIDMELFSANVIISKPDEAETLGGLYTIHGYLSLQMKRKMEMKDRCTSGTGNKESPCNSARTPNTCRFDSSLVRATKKFLELFDKAPDSSLDLNKAAETLEVPKRRLYDITGVLEGIGLIEKKHKNAICWKIQEEPNSELNALVARLKASIEDFISKEHELDEQISEMQGRIKKLIEDEKAQKLLFLTESDLKGLPGFKKQTLIAVRAPQGTTLEVPDPDQHGDGTQRRYRFIVRSNAGPIQVHLVSKLEEDFGGATENSMACLGSNGQSETIPSDDANPDDTVYWLSSDPGFSISDLWDLSPEVKWDHFLASEVPTVRPGRETMQHRS
ncbi:transcription factor E2FA-like isoform X2 [Carex rostrata]